MEFAGFDWDRGNQKKCQKHGLSIAEIESVFDRRVVILPDKGESPRRTAVSGDRNHSKGPQRVRGVYAARRR
jgi:uncharacterized DUF497 family protein